MTRTTTIAFARLVPILTALAVAVSGVVMVGAEPAHAATPPQPVPGARSAASEPPPGGLVDSEPNVGWTRGEFSVSDDGAAQYRVPLWVPAGRGAVTPELSLSYNSRAGNGLLGVGWSLGGLSTISWCGRTIAQDGYTDGGHFDGRDALCLNGSRLVPISPAFSPTREYRTEQETFSRIIAFDTQDNVPNSFKVFTKDGMALTFGGRTEARVQPFALIGSPLPDPSLVRMPGAPRATTAWVLDRIEDRNGNATTVEYTRSEGGPAGLWWTQLRPWRISYAPNREVRFVYEDRPDKIDGFSGGTHTRTDVRMSRIEMLGGPADGPAELLRQYRIRYRVNGLTGRSLLSSVTECDGADLEPDSPSSATRRCKLPVPFQYSLGRYRFEKIDVDASDPTPLSVVDVNGDGLSDLVGAAHNGPDLRVAMPQRPDKKGFAPPRNSGLPSHDVVQTLDVDADGRSDVLAEVLEVESGDSGFRYQLWQPNHEAAPEFEVVPGKLGEFRPFNSNRQPVYLADLDGSGLPDFVGTAFDANRRWTYRLNSGGSGSAMFELRRTTLVRRNIAFGNFVVDTNGDGRSELIGLQAGGGAGYANWGLNASGGVQVGLVNLDEAPTAIHFGDVNGDGLVDSVQPYRLGPEGGLRVQLNSGNGFGSRFAAPSPEEYTKLPFNGSLGDNGVRVVDFNGDGRDDVLVFHAGTPHHGETGRGLQVYTWSDNAFVRADLDLEIGSPNASSWDNTQVLDFNGDGLLDLVNAGTNGRLQAFQRMDGVPDQLIGIGGGTPRGRTEIRYTTLADRAVHTPGTCAYPQTCPLSGGTVVAEHSITSDFDTDTTPTWDRYLHKYEGARADLHGRGWLGFAKHTVTRVATGATTVTEFNNVTFDPETQTYPFAQLPKKVTYTVKNANDGTGREFRSVTTHDYRLRRFDIGTYTVQQRQATTTELEHPVGASPWETLRTAATKISYDDFDNPDMVKSTTVGGRTLTENFDYRNDTAAWLIGLRTRAVSTGCSSDGVCRTRESKFDYDDKGNPTVTVVEPSASKLRLTTTTGYGPFGVVTSVIRTDRAGHSRTETREYDNADQLYPTATVNAAGHRTLIDSHSGLGVPLSITDPNGVETTFRYDGFGRLREVNHSDGSFEHITRSRLGDRQLTTTTVAGGGETAELVDPLGRVRERQVKTFDGVTATTLTDYDSLGRGVRRTSRPALPGETLQYTVTQYDNRGRVTSVTAADGARVRHEYINRETHTYDAKGVHSYTIDSVDGQVDSRYECATLDPGGCVGEDPNSTNWLITSFGYGPFGETAKTFFKPDKTSQTTHYDVLGRPDFQRTPSSGDTITTYNAFGEVASITDAENRVTTFEYDVLGRVIKTTSPDGVATNTWGTAAPDIGKLTEARSTDGVTIGHTYDDLGRDATTTWTIQGTRYEFGYHYDAIGRPDCVTYPMIPEATGPGATDRLAVGHVYNPHGYLAQAKDGCQAGGTVYWAAKAVNVAGQLERERLGNGVVTTRTYRAATGVLDRIRTTGPGTIGRLGEIAYDYDANRNVTHRNDLVHERFETYHYDVLNRLDNWSIGTDPEQPAMDTTYTYKPVGDLKTETIHTPNQPDKTTTYRYGENGARAHWLTSRNDQTYGYDRTGQQVTGPNRTVLYNTAGLPTVLDWTSGQGQVQHTEFAYDPNGARVLKRDNHQTTITVAGLFERRTTAGNAGNETHNLHNIIVGGRIVAQVDRSQDASGELSPVNNATYLHNDQQGSTVALTNSNGELIGDDDPSLGQLFYDPFGRRINAHNDPLDDSTRDGPRQGYTSHQHDDELGLINMNGRIYDPKTRRFLTPDPIQTPISSQTYNRYSYVLNNPATLTDPTGFVWDPPTDGGTGSTGPFGPGPFPSSNGPFIPGSDCRMLGASSGCGSGWLGRILSGVYNETPTPNDADPAPSSDDDTSSTAQDDSDYVVDDEDCPPPCEVIPGETIEIQGRPTREEAPSDSDEMWAGTRNFSWLEDLGSIVGEVLDLTPWTKGGDLAMLGKLANGAFSIRSLFMGVGTALTTDNSVARAEGISDAVVSGLQLAPLVAAAWGVSLGPVGAVAAIGSALNHIPFGRDYHGDRTNIPGRVANWTVGVPLFLPRTGGAWEEARKFREWKAEVDEVMMYVPR